MFAVIKTGGKQYRVATDDVLQVEKIAGNPGDVIEFGEVLVVGGDTPLLGTPTVAGALVAGEVLEQGRGPKVIAFKKRRRKNSRRKRGTQWHPGPNVGMGVDHTLFALIDGRIEYRSKSKNRTFVSVVPMTEAAAE